MRQFSLLIIAFIFILGSCTGQQNNEKTGKSKDTIKPTTSYHVNEEYDDDGNLIRYDSSYSYYYSNIEGDKDKADSIFGAFKTKFKAMYPVSFGPFFDEFFFKDSLLKYDFYKNDFFMKRHQLNKSLMDAMFFKMDSFKNEYFNKQFADKDKENKN